MFGEWFQRLFSRSTPPPHAPINGQGKRETRKPTFGGRRPLSPTRLLLEILEDRVVPAQLAWTNGSMDGLWSTAANWTDLLGGPSVVPGSSDYVIYQAPGTGIPGSLTDCLMDVSSAAVDRVMMDSSYTGKLTIDGGKTLTTNNQFVQYGDLELEGGATIDAGTFFDINGDVFTVGFGSAATLTTTGDFFHNSGATITVAGFVPQLDIISGGFDDAGTINVGGTFSAALTITGTYVQAPGGVINVTDSSNLDFFTGGTDYPIIEGTINLRGDLSTDTQLAINGGTLNSVGGTSMSPNTISGNVRVYNAGVFNIGTSTSTSSIDHLSGSLTIGALDPNGAPTGGELNVYWGCDLEITAAASTSTFIVANDGEINLYGGLITMNTTRCANLELQALNNGVNPGTLNSYGYATFPVASDTIVGNLLNNGLVRFLGSAFHTLSVSNNYTQGSSGTLNMRLGNSSTNDVLSVGNAASLNGTLDLDGSSLANNQTWTIILTINGISGNFSTPLWPDSDPDWRRSGAGNLYNVTNAP